MKPVLEVKFVRPVEIAWEGEAPMPVISIRRPDKVKFDPTARRVFVDTGRGPKSFDLSQVERMAVEGEWENPAPPPTPSQLKASASETRPTNPPGSGQGPTTGQRQRK